MSVVLVTGGSGFVGSHTILQLLAAGHQVRTTVRSAKRQDDVLALLASGGASADARASLEFRIADLESDVGWSDAVAGCDYVLHVASPFPGEDPKDENEVIGPAREGTLRVLRAARDGGVKRVVATSSFAAIGYGHAVQTRPFDESDWSNVADKSLSAYIRSKGIAERAAWDFIAQQGGELELTTVNPVGIFGPVLGADFAGSIGIVKGMLDGEMPAVPKITFGVVDVRDVADLHLRAMTHPLARGERFLAAAGSDLSMLEVGAILRRHLGAAAKKVPTRELPNWLVRLVALVRPELRGALSELGKRKPYNGDKARRILGWSPRSNEEAITATADSLARLGLLKDAAR